jgi:hypothetical protein
MPVAEPHQHAITPVMIMITATGFTRAPETALALRLRRHLP